jgi:hypothetical protein
MTTGTIEYQLRKFTKNSEKCFVRDFETTNSVFRHLNLDVFKGVFAILMSGYALSLVFFIAELVIRNKDLMKRKFLILLTIIKRKILLLKIKFKHLLSCIWWKMTRFFERLFQRFI